MPVPPRDLRNHYGTLLARAEAGEHIDIERDGRVIATLGPPRRPSATARAKVVEVFRASEPVDAGRFFADLYGEAGLDDSFGEPPGQAATA